MDAWFGCPSSPSRSSPSSSRVAGEVVTREEVRHALWPDDTFVDFDVSLNSAIKRLRDALDDSAEKPRFVETLPRRGYRFIAPWKRHRCPRRRGLATGHRPPSGPRRRR